MFFLNADIGWLVSYSFSFKAGGARIYWTQDGGESWVPRVIPSAQPTWLRCFLLPLKWDGP